MIFAQYTLSTHRFLSNFPNKHLLSCLATLLLCLTAEYKVKYRQLEPTMEELQIVDSCSCKQNLATSTEGII